MVLALTLGVMGCSETAGTGGDGGAGGEGGTGGSAGSEGTATLSNFVFEIPSDGPLQPLEGVQVCETDTTNCTTTDGEGNAALDLPVDREISYTLVKEGYVKYLRGDVLSAAGSYVATRMLTDAQIASQYERVMAPPPMEATGIIGATATSDELGFDGIAGATFELVGATAELYYEDEDENWRRNLSATTCEGSGNFIEVDPDVHEMEISGAVKNCEVHRGWPSGSGDTMRVPVREGYRTIARWVCDPELAQCE